MLVKMSVFGCENLWIQVEENHFTGCLTGGRFVISLQTRGKLSVVVHACAREAEAQGMWVWGQPGLVEELDQVFLSRCCDIIPWKKKQLSGERDHPHWRLMGPAHHGRAVKVARAWSSCHITSSQEAEEDECLLLLSPFSNHSGWISPSQLVQVKLISVDMPRGSR